MVFSFDKLIAKPNFLKTHPFLGDKRSIAVKRIEPENYINLKLLVCKRHLKSSGKRSIRCVKPFKIKSGRFLWKQPLFRKEGINIQDSASILGLS